VQQDHDQQAGGNKSDVRQLPVYDAQNLRQAGSVPRALLTVPVSGSVAPNPGGLKAAPGQDVVLAVKLDMAAWSQSRP
jgi:hypothetical protein